DEAVLLETNIDDMSPELFPHVIARLLDAGAHDAWVTPIVMKKGRPAFTLSALCDPEREESIANVIFAETTTLGTRSTRVSKRALKREWVETHVAGARVRVKIGRRNGDITTVAPEHDDAVAAAEQTGLPLKQVYALAVEQVTPRN
ncbi:MAG: LarC family nickel insertion protein, partial [Actinomycetota bacterium]|nr:LarC family nickel insertion protein [Actinomycetota bacterium]